MFCLFFVLFFILFFVFFFFCFFFLGCVGVYVPRLSVLFETVNILKRSHVTRTQILINPWVWYNHIILPTKKDQFKTRYSEITRENSTNKVVKSAQRCISYLLQKKPQRNGLINEERNENVERLNNYLKSRKNSKRATRRSYDWTR